MTNEVSSQEISPEEQDAEAELPEAEPTDDELLVEAQASPTRTSRRPLRVRIAAWITIVAVAGGSGFLLFRTLGDASLSFLSVDRAVGQRDDLGDRRFQLHGTPVPQTITVWEDQSGQTLAVFALAGENAELAAWVIHEGDPPDLFQPCVPVVLEGSWADVQGNTIDLIRPEDRPVLWDTTFADGYYFASDRILVKHDNEYRLEDGQDNQYFQDSQEYSGDDSAHGDAVLSRFEGCP